MNIRALLSGPSVRTRIALAVIGLVLLALTVNQLLWQRWGFAAVQGAVGLGFLLAGLFLSDAALSSRTTADIFKTAFLSVLLVAGIAAIAVVFYPASEIIGLWMPGILALWLLAVGARFARRRASVVTFAVVASLLFLLQAGIFSVLILANKYHFEHRTEFQLMLGVVIVTGVAAVYAFVRAKWIRQASNHRGSN